MEIVKLSENTSFRVEYHLRLSRFNNLLIIARSKSGVPESKTMPGNRITIKSTHAQMPLASLSP